MEDAAADKQSLAELGQAKPSRITAAPGRGCSDSRGHQAIQAVRGGARRCAEAAASRSLQEQGPFLQQHQLSRPVPLPVPQQLGKPRARAVPEQASQPPTARPTDSASIDTSTGSTPSTLAPLPVSPETQPGDGAAAVSLEPGSSAEGLQEMSPAASQRTEAAGVEEAAVTASELAIAERAAAEQGAEEPDLAGQPLDLPDLPKPLPKPAQPPAKRPAPVLQASQVIISIATAAKAVLVQHELLALDPEWCILPVSTGQHLLC